MKKVNIACGPLQSPQSTGTAMVIQPYLFGGSQLRGRQPRVFPQPQGCRLRLAACWVLASWAVPMGRAGRGAGGQHLEERRPANPRAQRRARLPRGAGGMTLDSRRLVVLDSIWLFTEGFFCFFFGVFVGFLSL